MPPRTPTRARARRCAAVLAAAAAFGLVACERGAREPSAAAPRRGTAPWAAAPDVSPPTTPENVQAKPSAEGVDLSWNASADDVRVEGYEVLRDDGRVVWVEGPRAQDALLRPGQRNCYTVVAFDRAGNRSAPSSPACLDAPDVTSPSAPAELSAKLVSRDEIELRLAPSTDDVAVAGYEVLRGGAAVASTAEPRLLLTRLPPGRRLCHAVRAFDASGNRSEASPAACVTTPDVAPPSPPAELVATARGGTVELRWAASTDDVGVAHYEVRRDGALVARGPATSAAESNLRADARYCYTVRAYDAAGNASEPAEPACAVVPDVTPPTAPAAVAALAEPAGMVTVRWSAAADDVGVVRYEVVRDGAIVAKTDALRAAFRGLRPASPHCFRVRACDAAGNCSPTSAGACIALPDVEPPSQVAHVTATAASDTRIALRWEPASDDVGVVRYEVREGSRLVGATEGETGIVDAGLRPATRRCYVVVASDAAGNASRPSAPACAATPDLAPPEVPSNVIAVPRSSREIFVAWARATDDVGVAGYEVLRDGAVVATTERLQAAMDGLSPGTAYCHAVRAFDAAGNRSAASDPVCTATAPPSTPVAPWNLRADAGTRGLELSWDPSPTQGVVYVVFWDRGRSDRPIGTTPGSTFRVFGSAAMEPHCYRVAAVDERQRESPRTLPVCASVRKLRGSTADARSPERAARTL